MEKIFTIELTENEVNFVLQSLGDLPAKTSMGLILKIKNQADSQIRPGPKSPLEDTVKENMVMAEDTPQERK
jgi:hypothetical protein